MDRTATNGRRQTVRVGLHSNELPVHVRDDYLACPVEIALTWHDHKLFMSCVDDAVNDKIKGDIQ
jgi:hypothetical protein